MHPSYFPRTRFVDENGLFKQLEHIQSELNELIDAYFHDPIGRVAEEAFDLIHSVETFLFRLQEERGIDLDQVREHVKSKNQARGYYD